MQVFIRAGGIKYHGIYRDIVITATHIYIDKYFLLQSKVHTMQQHSVSQHHLRLLTKLLEATSAPKSIMV